MGCLESFDGQGFKSTLAHRSFWIVRYVSIKQSVVPVFGHVGDARLLIEHDALSRESAPARDASGFVSTSSVGLVKNA